MKIPNRNKQVVHNTSSTTRAHEVFTTFDMAPKGRQQCENYYSDPRVITCTLIFDCAEMDSSQNRPEFQLRTFQPC